MEIIRAGSRPSARKSADWFTGTVRIDPLFAVADPSRTAANAVTFEPGARTAWHASPRTDADRHFRIRPGAARGGPVEDIRPGDVVRFAPGEKHWHSAAPGTAMIHIAVQESLDGEAVAWMEHISDDEYRGFGDAGEA